MNKSYEYVDGKIILEDKKGVKHLENVCNNTYEIIRQENLLEDINRQIEEAEIQKEKLAPNKLVHIIEMIIWLSITISFSFISMLGSINFSIPRKIILTLLFMAFGLMGTIMNHITYCNDLKKTAGIKKVIEYLKEKKILEEKTLEKRKNESKEIPNNELEKGYKEIKVDDSYSDILNTEINNSYNEGIQEYTLTRKKKNSFNK